MITGRGVRGASVLVILLLMVGVHARGVRDLARREQGDTFTLPDEDCVDPPEAVQSGCAGYFAVRRAGCGCQCPAHAPLYRDDVYSCVANLTECSLALWGVGAGGINDNAGNGGEVFPLVFLPLPGQIIHPSRDIDLGGVGACAVSGAGVLGPRGISSLRDSRDDDVPFQLYRDQGRTYLQWLGSEELRARVSGRAVVVRLLCRDVITPPAAPAPHAPCVAFRVHGPAPATPQPTNVTEVSFTPNAQTLPADGTSLSVTEYVAIGASSVLLALVYVASVLLYLHVRKRRASYRATSPPPTRRLDHPVNDVIHVTNERLTPLSLPPPTSSPEGVVKKNPLLNMRSESKSSCPSDSSTLETEDFSETNLLNNDNFYKRQTTSALVHSGGRAEHAAAERAPDELAIVETGDPPHAHHPSARRKLYFNPAYFEPHLMAEPPPAALEFLTKIREVISIAKQKMAAKKFQPVLNEIPEEETLPSAPPSLRRPPSQRETSHPPCAGCPGCAIDLPSCHDCLGQRSDKQTTIRKWLEDLPTGKHQPSFSDFSTNSLRNISYNENRSRKQNCFSVHSMELTDFHRKRPKSTLSVRSEPSVRNNNLPLPDFRNICGGNRIIHYGQTVAKASDIRPVGLGDYRPHSLRSNSTAARRKKSINNNNVLPDMVNDALDRYSKTCHHSSSDDEPTNRNVQEIKQNHLRNRSESPSGNDYETDSLERTSNKKGAVTPADYSDIPSSQASPSLSNALPLEEELTMRNDVYKTQSSSNSNTPSPQRELRIPPTHYETTKQVNLTNECTEFEIQKTDYSLVSEVYVNNNYNFNSAPTSPSASDSSMGNRKLDSGSKNSLEEKPGCLTIEVKDPPENYIKIHESDGFEPDTLDRKNSKKQEVLEKLHFSRKEILKNISCDDNLSSDRDFRSGSFDNFKTSSESNLNSLDELNRKLEYPNTLTLQCGAKSLESSKDFLGQEVECEWDNEQGRILTLELRHSKRQRQCTPPTVKQLKNLPRPDILPPLPPCDESIYEHPINPPRRVDTDLKERVHPKNGRDRSFSPRRHSSDAIPDVPARCKRFHSPRASVGPFSSDHDTISASLDNKSILENREVVTTNRQNRINTNTFVKQKVEMSRGITKRRRGVTVEDSGYLSSDSCPRSRTIAVNTASCSSDESGDSARSESGAESVETSSVYFGSYQTPITDSFRGVRNSRKLNHTARNMP